MKVTLKFDDIKMQYKIFLKLLDLVRTGMFSDNLTIGPFNDILFRKDGFSVKGKREEVLELISAIENEIPKDITFNKTLEE